MNNNMLNLDDILIININFNYIYSVVSIPL